MTWSFIEDGKMIIGDSQREVFREKEGCSENGNEENGGRYSAFPLCPVAVRTVGEKKPPWESL